MIKKYIIFSIVLILLIGGFVYMNTDSYFTFGILGINITLPVAVWSMVFLGFFALFSVIFLFVGHIKSYFFMKNYEKDVRNILFNIKAKLFKKQNLKDVKLKELKEINEFIKGIDGLEITKGYGEFEKIIDDLIKIKNNEYVDLSKYKLDKNNEWIKLNSKNEIESFDKTQLVKILKKEKDDELTKQALVKYSTFATFKEIMKFDNYQFNKEIIFNIIKNNELSYKDVIALIEKTKPQIKDIKLFGDIEFSDKDYLELALMIDEKYSPDELMEIFKNNDLAYVYILIKYEMIDKARDIVKDKDLEFFEDYFVCRDCGKKVDIKEYAKDRLQRN